MAENRQNSCCVRAMAEAHLADHTPTHADLAWLFGISVRWVGELRKRGILTPDTPLPVLVKRMARYKPEAKKAGRTAKLARRSKGAKNG